MKAKDFTPDGFLEIPKGTKISARRLELETKSDTKVFVFSETEGVYTCLLEADPDLLKLPTISGLEIRYEKFAESGEAQHVYILLECRSQIYLKHFTDILKEILTEYDGGNQGMSSSLDKVISRWRYFLSAPTNQILTEDDIVGLFGELFLLSHLIETKGAEYVRIWTADVGGEDFIHKNLSIEVKTTLRGRHQHVVNGIDQMLVAPNRSKYLLSLLLERADLHGSGWNLPKLIERIAVDLSEYPEIRGLFYQKLKLRGYDIRDSKEYEQYFYNLIRGCFFEVNENFPKLTTQSLLKPLSPRVSKVRYTIDLEGLPSLDFYDFDITQLDCT